MQPEPETPDGDDAAPSADAATALSPRVSPGRAGWQLSITVAALVLGLCGLAVGTAGVVTQILPRTFTAAQQRQIVAWEMARRWRTTPAGKIFPADARYRLSGFALNAGSELALTAHRLGIARQATCAAGTDAAAARVLDRLGCEAVLRATYADSTSSLLVTVGVAVLPGSATARQAVRDLAAAGGGRGKLQPGLRPAAFPGTLAARFGDRQRQLNWDGSAGPYLIMSTVGYADGRPRVRVASDAYADQEMSSLARGVAEVIRAPLGVPPPAPRCPGTPGC
jgi:hypothetical protein